MATQKRSSSGKRTTTGKKTTAGGRRTAAPKKRPIRREVGGVVCLVLALCIAFSYFQQGGWLLDQPAALCRGLVGYGYYTVAPVLLLVSYILLFHRGRNVTACVVGAALLPVLCYHYCIEAARLGFAVPTALIGRGMADWVEIGLAWFFLLSGAALCLQWQGRFDARRYFVGRAAATYPAFWLGFAALFVYGEVLHGNNADIPRWRVVFSVLGLDGYLAPVTVTFYKIGEWFLGVILILYLVFPLLLWCMETPLRRRALGVLMAVLAVVWPLVCPAPWEAGHTVLGRLPAFALGVWFGSSLKNDVQPSYRICVGLAVCPLLWVDAVPRLAVLLVLAAVLFWAVYAAGQRLPRRFCPALRRLAGWCYGVYLVHHVLLTLVFLRVAARFDLPLTGMFPVYLVVSFALAAVLMAVSGPISKAIKKLA